MKHYDPNATGDVGLFLSARVYTSVGSFGVPGKTITVRVSYIFGGMTRNATITLGPTDANGFARACPAQLFPASAQLTVSTDAVDNSPGSPGAPLDDLTVQNISRNGTPAFCQ